MTAHASGVGSRVAVRLSVAAAVLFGVALLSGCSTNVGDLQWPAVHDMPPARGNATLSDAEQKKAEQELLSARDSTEARAQQNAQAAAQASGQPADTTGSTKPAAPGSGQTTGGNR